MGKIFLQIKNQYGQGASSLKNGVYFCDCEKAMRYARANKLKIKSYDMSHTIANKDGNCVFCGYAAVFEMSKERKAHLKSLEDNGYRKEEKEFFNEDYTIGC